jgi:hypothetical protein
MYRRPLTLDCVPESLLGELGIVPGTLAGSSYRCSVAEAFLVRLSDLVVPPERKLNEEALISILLGIRDGEDRLSWCTASHTAL